MPHDDWDNLEELGNGGNDETPPDDLGMRQDARTALVAAGIERARREYPWFAEH